MPNIGLRPSGPMYLGSSYIVYTRPYRIDVGTSVSSALVLLSYYILQATLEARLANFNPNYLGFFDLYLDERFYSPGPIYYYKGIAYYRDVFTFTNRV